MSHLMLESSDRKFKPLYTLPSRIRDADFSDDDFGRMLLDYSIRHAVQYETMHKKKPSKFQNSEVSFLTRNISEHEYVPELSYRLDEIFNSNDWAGLRRVNGFSEAAAYLFLERSQSTHDVVHWFSDPKILDSFEKHERTGMNFKDLPTSESQRNRLSYKSALDSLCKRMEHEWGVKIAHPIVEIQKYLRK